MRASRIAAGYGARVAIAEPGRFGGTCVNVGCIPKKLFSYAAHWREEFEVARAYGWTAGEPRFDWRTLLASKDREIARLNGVYERLLADAGVAILRSRASVRDAHTVEADGRAYSAKHILVATGSWPQLPAIPGCEHAITSNEAFFLEQLPRRALLVGGSYIAGEFAPFFNGIVVETTLAYRGKRLLRGFDGEIGEHLAEEMAKKGVAIRLESNPSGIEKAADGLRVQFEGGSEGEFDLVMFATGRTPNTANLGLDAAGVALAEDGAVVVDRFSRSSVDSIHAIGDVTNRMQLTPVATAEAMWLPQKPVCGGGPPAAPQHTPPTAVFANPNVAVVGLSEESARERYGAVDVYKTSFRALKLSLTDKQERTFMKLVVDRASQRVVGAHMIGADAGEIIQGVAIAVKLGATKAQFDATIGIHPTVAEEFVTLREKAA